MKDQKFELFWKTYDRKVGKQNTIKEWNKLDLIEQEKAIEGAKHYANSCEADYRLHPERFLKYKRFNDKIAHTTDEKSIPRTQQGNGKSTYHLVSCSANGCPLGKVVQNDVTYTRCQYHEFTDGDTVQEVTHRIRQNKRWLDGFRKMSAWNHDDWGRYSASLLKSEFLPMREHEPPSMYMNRYFQRLNEIITENVK